jgi:hypothetical protein
MDKYTIKTLIERLEITKRINELPPFPSGLGAGYYSGFMDGFIRAIKVLQVELKLEESLSDEEGIAEDFLRKNVLIDSSSFELAGKVYTAYKNQIEPHDPTLVMSQNRFIRFVKKYNPLFKLVQKRDEGQPVLCFLNLKLIPNATLAQEALNG